MLAPSARRARGQAIERLIEARPHQCFALGARRIGLFGLADLDDSAQTKETVEARGLDPRHAAELAGEIENAVQQLAVHPHRRRLRRPREAKRNIYVAAREPLAGRGVHRRLKGLGPGRQTAANVEAAPVHALGLPRPVGMRRAPFRPREPGHAGFGHGRWFHNARAGEARTIWLRRQRNKSAVPGGGATAALLAAQLFAAPLSVPTAAHDPELTSATLIISDRQIQI